ncbi:hypothetical protein R1sor_006328 [Riccia sorocarpa]|uniref:Methyltransferase domain-containing protein n=1 Tax=Riccia sorocarpa TaxID=122646 RepID=A0ABD3HQ34_9MARC
MPHASTWLEYSWNLRDLVVYGLEETGESQEAQLARSSRRDKFRLNAGASREELLWAEILGILRKVRPLPPLAHPSQDAVTTANHGSIGCKLSAPSERGTPCSETAHNGGSSDDARLNYLLEEVYWPVEKIGDIASMRHIEILWDTIPASADPVLGGGYKTAHTRGTVDFGSGSGALTLPLAAIFPEFTFVGVDFKLRSIILLEDRARKGNLLNVKAVYGRIENYSAPFDACVALHACGIATDLALLQAMKNRAAYVMSPCCIGKLQIPVEWTLNSTDSGFSFRESPSCNRVQESKTPGRCGIVYASDYNEKISQNSSKVQIPLMDDNDIKTAVGLESQDSGQFCLERWQGSVSSSLSYPRSSWLRNCISEKEFQVLARAADWSSYDFESFSSQLHSLCKVVLELDRNEASREVGYWTGLYTLANEKAGTVGVSHVLVGKPE